MSYSSTSKLSIKLLSKKNCCHSRQTMYKLCFCCQKVSKVQKCLDKNLLWMTNQIQKATSYLSSFLRLRWISILHHFGHALTYLSPTQLKWLNVIVASVDVCPYKKNSSSKLISFVRCCNIKNAAFLSVYL